VATVIYVHGFGDTPDGPVGHRVMSSLTDSKLPVNLVTPWVRPAQEVDGKVQPVGRRSQSPDDEIRRVRAAIQAEPGPVILVAHSLGGYSSLALEPETRGKVLGIVGIAPSVMPVERNWRALAGDRPMPTDPQALKDVFAARHRYLTKEARHTDPSDRHYRLAQFKAGASGLLEEQVDHDEDQMSHGLQTPMYLITGSADKQVPASYERGFAWNNAPFVDYHEVDGLDHNLKGPEAQQGQASNEIAQGVRHLLERAGLIPQEKSQPKKTSESETPKP
jgi:pimeloyl-ACP methyl ester carboxylesterase